ncbi:putative phosphoesterase [Thermosporothrix hazakensis]|jgi:putative phosphoesterase|uniref:Metallophosphoesterase n=2 Tax=Thermosporothrix TaxID=768650 RepID=A0A455SKX6_9CHLR|nr:metallophosphoesterase family protein [Thermosporothrix hazakensis]PZW36569.1 putative phosphoesterase [Thermosporothrix hazakensis]BBH89037.1 metallophosphoesterase [Thermosporothrix sp. COM3]GCE47221.1 metallophosphoesterase [Thermosporothrix hazakensis]
MRIAIISDIHGNQVALEAVLHDLSQQAPVDHLVIAGDLCLNGPRPKEVLQLIQSLQCPVIQGNVDVDTITGAPTKSPKKRRIIAWTQEQIGQEGIDYLSALPFSHLITNPHGSNALIVHASPRTQNEAIFPTASDETLEEQLGSLNATIGALAFGHLHIPYVRHWRQLLLVDVGSCGLPRDEDARASYGLLTWQDGSWHAEIRRVSYDIEQVVRQLRECGIPHARSRIKILTTAKY